MGWHWGILAGSGGTATASAFDLLSTTLLTANAASVTFNSIDSYTDYKHLQLRITSKSSGTGDDFLITMNGSTASLYNAHYLAGNGSTVASVFQGANASNIQISNALSQASTASAFSGNIIDFLDFQSNNKHKTIRLFGGRGESPYWVQLASGTFRNLGTVTSLTISTGADFVSGSRFSLYGIRG